MLVFLNVLKILLLSLICIIYLSLKRLGCLLIEFFKKLIALAKRVIVSLLKNYVDELKEQWDMFMWMWERRKILRRRTGLYKRLKDKGTILLKSNLKTFFWWSVVGLIFIGFPIQVMGWYNQLPSPDLLMERGREKSTKILSRDGELLYEIYVDRKYDPVTLDQIPDHMIRSTLAIEDDHFFVHNGIRPLSIVRAAKANILDDEMQGGSTITQQLVKNVLLSSDRTIERKAKEAILALIVERKYTKDQILELYFNNIPYGGTAWGVQSAAQKYFGKNIWELDLAESSLLAGLPSAPTTYSPLNGNYEISKQRQRIVLNRMVLLGYISKEEGDAAYEKTLTFISQEDYIRAPHFVEYVRDELNNKYGTRMVNFGGMTVTTSLDLKLQDQVQQIIKEEVEKSRYLDITNGAAVVLSPKDGEILAYVGSKDYFLDDWGAFDVLTAFRQAGSAIKPLTYSLAFKDGMTPWTLIDDKPVVFKNEWETYKPVNYDGKYHGKVSLRSALANSYNIPAVKLANKIGADNIVSLGKDLGLNNWKVDGSYGISVTLGGKEVRPLDLANVYATYARGGVFMETTPFISVKDLNGREIYKRGSDRRVISEEIAYLITSILSDQKARLPAFGVNNFLSIKDHDVAVKTGTTDQKRDNWTIGYTPSYVVAVWTGNNDNTPMNKKLASGLSGAAPIWNRIMNMLLTATENEKFHIPDGVFVKTDGRCGKSEVFIRGSKVPSTLCIDRDDKKDGEKKSNST